MKKASQYSLLLVTCAFIFFVSGLFLGRNADFQLVEHTNKPDISESIPNDLIVYSKEIYINGKLNINAAGKEDLILLPGIGDTLSDRIIAYREENGCFNEIDELLCVDGMGNSKLAKIKEYLTVGNIK